MLSPDCLIPSGLHTAEPQQAAVSTELGWETLFKCGCCGIYSLYRTMLCLIEEDKRLKVAGSPIADKVNWVSVTTQDADGMNDLRSKLHRASVRLLCQGYLSHKPILLNRELENGA